MQNSHQGTRLHALDAVRAIAVLSGIALHSALSYAPGVDSQLWPFRDSQNSLAMSVTIFLVHIFKMPVFFLLAGFFAQVMSHREGSSQFLRNRAKRILGPLVIGWLACAIGIGGVALWFLIRMNDGQMPKMVPPEFARPEFSFLHLWFLYILLWLYAGAVLCQKIIRTIDQKNVVANRIDGIIGTNWPSPFKSLLLAAPIIVAFVLQPDWKWWFGIPTPGYTLIPPIAPLCIYGYFFALGWMLARQRELLNDLGSSWFLRLLIGLGAACGCLAMAGSEVSTAVADAQMKAIYATLYGITTVSLALAFIGLGVRFLPNASNLVRYLSDASYWMYVAHLPIVMALQTLLHPFELPWFIKFVAVNVASCAALLLTYRYYVRSSWIGQMLNGRKY